MPARIILSAALLSLVGAVIGGLSVSTVVTLIFVPATRSVVQRRKR